MQDENGKLKERVKSLESLQAKLHLLEAMNSSPDHHKKRLRTRSEPEFDGDSSGRSEDGKSALKKSRLGQENSNASPSSTTNKNDTEELQYLEQRLVRSTDIVTNTTSLTAFGDAINHILPQANVQFNEFDRNAIDEVTSQTILIHAGDKYILESLKIGEAPLLVDLPFPSLERALKCLNAFNSFLGSHFYFINAGRFKHALRKFYTNNSPKINVSRDDVLFYTSLLMVLAVGEMYLADGHHLDHFTEIDPKTLNGFPGIQYFNKATIILNFGADSLQAGKSSVENVQALLLHAFYCQIIDASTDHYLKGGAAMRTALLIGLHNDTGKSSISRHELEHRRRLWWCLYIVDRYCCAKSGLPFSISDESITTELPANIPASVTPDELCQYDEFPDASYMIHFIKVSQISSDMVFRLYHRKSRKDLISIMLNTIAEIDSWRENLPDRLKVDYTQKNFKTSRLIVSIHSEYFHCINLTIRPVLLFFVRKRLRTWRTNRAPIYLSKFDKDIISLLNASLQASIQTLRSHSILSSRNELAKFGYLDREYIYSAMTTLILFNVAFSVNESASQEINAGLDLLTQMERVRNSYAAQRKQQILHLIQTFEQNGIPAHHFLTNPVPHQEFISTEPLTSHASELELENMASLVDSPSQNSSSKVSSSLKSLNSNPSTGLHKTNISSTKGGWEPSSHDSPLNESPYVRGSYTQSSNSQSQSNINLQPVAISGEQGFALLQSIPGHTPETGETNNSYIPLGDYSNSPVNNYDVNFTFLDQNGPDMFDNLDLSNSIVSFGTTSALGISPPSNPYELEALGLDGIQDKSKMFTNAESTNTPSGMPENSGNLTENKDTTASTSSDALYSLEWEQNLLNEIVNQTLTWENTGLEK